MENNNFIENLPSDIEFTSLEMKQLEQLSEYEVIIDKFIVKTLNKLKNKMLDWKLTPDYVVWAKSSMLSFKDYFKFRKK